MSISLIDNFNINVKKPIDGRTLVANASERNAIPNAYRHDNLNVFQIDDRKTYVWNDVTQTWVTVGDYSVGTGTVNTMAVWNTANTIAASFIYVSINSGTNGYLGINSPSPKAELQIGSNIGAGVPMYFSSNSSSNVISDNWLNGGVIDSSARGSSNLYFSNGTIGVSSRVPGSANTMINRMSIGYDDFSISGVFNTTPLVELGTVANSYVKLTSIRANVGNVGFVQEFARRSATGNNWATFLYHNGISIDASFVVPGETRTFWERDPFGNVQHFGSEGIYNLSIDSTNNRIGVNNKTPLHTIDVLGAFANGSGPILKLENTASVLPANSQPIGAGIICKNIGNSTGGIFIGQLSRTSTSSGNEGINIRLVSTGVDLLSVDKLGMLRIGNVGNSTSSSDNMLVSESGLVTTRGIGDMMSNVNYVATPSRNGLMPKEFFAKVNSTRNIGWVGGYDVASGSGFISTGGDVLYVVRDGVGGPDSFLLVTFANPMSGTNYYVRTFVQSENTNMDYDNDLVQIVFRPISATQFRLGFREVNSVIQRLKIHIEVVQI